MVKAIGHGARAICRPCIGTGVEHLPGSRIRDVGRGVEVGVVPSDEGSMCVAHWRRRLSNGAQLLAGYPLPSEMLRRSQLPGFAVYRRGARGRSTSRHGHSRVLVMLV